MEIIKLLYNITLYITFLGILKSVSRAEYCVSYFLESQEAFASGFHES